MAGSLRLEGKILEIAKKMLRDTVDILDKCSIDYVLEAGTLLGIVRENRLLPWDNDVDVTITEAFEKILLKNRWRFLLKGYLLKIKKYKNDVGPFKKGTVRICKVYKPKFYLLKGYKLVDIFIKRPIDNDYFWTVAVKRPVLKSVPKRFYDEMTTLTWEKKEYKVPQDYEGFLEYCYGDWRTPVKNWNFRTGDNCVREELS